MWASSGGKAIIQQTIVLNDKCSALLQTKPTQSYSTKIEMCYANLKNQMSEGYNMQCVT